MTGSSMAYQLSRKGAAGEGRSILVLEAKDVASGASQSSMFSVRGSQRG